MDDAEPPRLRRALEAATPRRLFLGAAAGALAHLAAGATPTIARPNHPNRRCRQRPKECAPGSGATDLTIELDVESRMGRDLRDGVSVFINGRGGRRHEAASINKGGPERVQGHWEASILYRDDTVGWFAHGNQPPLFILLHNPDVWPLEVSIITGGGIDFRPNGGRRRHGATGTVVDRKWLLVGGSFGQRVGDMNIEISRSDNTRDNMLVRAVLKPA